ncbi:cytochrome c oxidase subunit 6C [Trichonephila inaurata madagascariensis]|uniref:Cytochrome c oxidase subunit 6C n=1 Tax=Trichonephila inaurata madagascariensis TaxID=2747483 RepID=A0A8X6YLP3_9ARAC|nr:cytochrome c oxidase subunit 6C [Trichonephila inaurata madagascariensis]
MRPTGLEVNIPGVDYRFRYLWQLVIEQTFLQFGSELAMSSSAVQKLAKPQLRGLFRSYLQKHLTIAIVSGIAGSIAWKFLVMDPRKKAYAEFYKTYDPDAEYKRMKEAGVLPPFPVVD